MRTQRPQRNSRNTAVFVLRLATRAREQRGRETRATELEGQPFTRSAQRERTVMLVSPADHAQHVKKRAVHKNVTQGVMDSPQQHREELP